MPLVQRQIESEEDEEWSPELDVEPAGTAGELEPVEPQDKEPEWEEEEIVQTKPAGGHTTQVSLRLAAQIRSLRGGGCPLSQAERNFMKPRFGHDFRHVRVHTDAKADAVARTVSARAFTVGRNVAFASGQYAPDTTEGKKLLAHELAHVIQQRTGVLIQRQTSAPSAGELVDPLTEIENQLKRRFTDPDDPRLAERRKKLNELFELLNPSAAESILDRLIYEKKSDVLAKHFQLLSRVTRKELLLILIDELNYEGTDTLHNFLRMTKAPRTRPEKQLYARIRDLVPDLKHRKEILNKLREKPITFTIKPPPAKDFCKPFTKEELDEGLDIVLGTDMGRFINEDIIELYGNETAMLWEDYINRVPGDSLTPKIFKEPSSQIVKAFVKHPATIKRQQELVKAVEKTLRGDFLLGACQNFPSGLWTDIPVLDLLTKDERNHPFTFGDVFTIPGLIAGGVSGSAAGKDSRSVSGKVQFLRTTDAAGNTKVQMRTRFRFVVSDAIDFCPGGMGGLLARFVTIPLSRLEASGWAYDVPFEVHYDGPPVEVLLKDEIVSICWWEWRK